MLSQARNSHEYVRVCFDVPAALADEAAGILVALGAMGCATKAPFVSHPLETKTVALEAYFERLSDGEPARLARTLAGAGMLTGSQRGPVVERVVDPGWSTLWMKRFKPLRVGRRLLIAPPWSNPRDGRRLRLRLVVRPAQAFGTGHHPTTRGVLRVLDALCADRHFQSALDVGTGSGILALAMKLFGAGQVVGIDTDKQALKNARENAALNGLATQVRFSSTPLSSLRHRFELIVANILSSTLLELAPKLKQLLRRDGRLVLSGILSDEVELIRRGFAPELRCLSRRVEHGWATLVFGR